MDTIKRDPITEVTGKIIASLEKGVVPWHQPWGFTQPAQNHFTGHRYRGINSLLMLLDDYKTPYFATIRQINEGGGRVKKGSKSTAVYFTDCLYKDKNGARLKPDEASARIKAGDKSVKKYPFMRIFPVFNMQDVEGCPVKPSSEILNADNQPIAICQDYVTSLSRSVRIEHSNSGRAYFNKKEDFVNVPELPYFINSERYYGVLFHELTHWTGHPDRLNRPTLTDALEFGDTNYSKEELTAELGACFLCNQHGINTPATDEQNASYIDHWLGVLKKDARFIWDTARDAQAALAFLNALADQ